METRDSIIILCWKLNNGDTEVRTELKAKILELAAFYRVPVKTNRPKKGNFKTVFVEFIENRLGFIDILPRLYDSV